MRHKLHNRRDMPWNLSLPALQQCRLALEAHSQRGDFRSPARESGRVLRLLSCAGTPPHTEDCNFQGTFCCRIRSCHESTLFKPEKRLRAARGVSMWILA